MDIFGEFFKKENLPMPHTWDSVITQSRQSPFSDKLMMFHVSMLSAAGLANYGMGMSMSIRRDIVATYSRCINVANPHISM
jgi:hypothetical protein